MFERWGIHFGDMLPLVDGTVPVHQPCDDGWQLESGERITLSIEDGDGVTRLSLRVSGAQRPLDSVGIRFAGVRGIQRFLANGYQSWDGSRFLDAGQEATGHAVTALIAGETAAVLGYERHDRFQTRLRFSGAADALTIDAETLLDRTGTTEGETLLLFAETGAEDALRRWSRIVAAASPTPPRLPQRRITGWCSWYNLYAAIDDAAILHHLDAARRFRDDRGVPLEVFQIDDGFTPEMGDWLSVKPQFPRGMAPLIADVTAAGFRPGLWIAPFMVGNRSRLAQDHPEWLVQDPATGQPVVQMRFYGEFRWHKRSEEYHILDITHPGAEAYMREVFRTWSHLWGARYFKVDFMLFGSEHGPDTARWHQPELSRIAIWRRMLTIMREEVAEDTLILGCGCPLWASVGLVDAIRIGRDVGVRWSGDQSAESLLRDQATRNHAAGILWQADPDCILLRDRYHELSDTQMESLALFAGEAGGVVMTSDDFSELSEDRQALFANILSDDVIGCDYPALGADERVMLRYVHRDDDSAQPCLFNPTADDEVYEGRTVPPFHYGPAT